MVSFYLDALLQGKGEEMNIQIGRFPVGKIVKSSEILGRISGAELLVFLCRHIQGDWGVVAKDVKETNDEAIASGLEITSFYYSRRGYKCIVITNAKRSHTTVTLG
jgi:hypothetical protein